MKRIDRRFFSKGFKFLSQERYGSSALTLCLTVALWLGCSVAVSEAFKLPDTGQTKCYRDVLPFDEIPCAGTGQDGAYNINPKSYTIIGANSDMVQDNNTGLIWQRQDDGNTYNWYQAVGEVNATYNPSDANYKNVCGDLVLGGYSDWRLSSKKELITIFDYSIPYPGPAINTAYFPNTSASIPYWLSTTAAYNMDHAWFGGFYGGMVYGPSVPKSVNYYVKCVRGGQDPQIFINNGSTVTDQRTGLIWQKQDDGVARTWGHALSYCEGLNNLGGYSDWRLPNIIELESIYIPGQGLAGIFNIRMEHLVSHILRRLKPVTEQS